MSDGEGSTQSTTTAVETGAQPDNLTVTAMAMDGQQQQNVTTTKDDGEPNPKKAKLSVGDVFGRGGGGGMGNDKQQSASEKLEHRLGGILCCAVCLDLPRAAIYQVRSVLERVRTSVINQLCLNSMRRAFRWFRVCSILKKRHCCCYCCRRTS